MIDLTSREEDKDKFITKVYLKEGEDFFHIEYASGREEVEEFSIHNLNVSFLTMERQFMEYKEDFIRRNKTRMIDAQINKLIEAIIAMCGVYFVSSIDMPVSLKALFIILAVFYTVNIQRQESLRYQIAKYSLNVIMTAENFLEHKEQFKIQVTNPKTLEKEDWYLVTLSDIETFTSYNELSLIGKSLTDEVKEEEAEKTSKVLKKIYDMKRDKLIIE